MSDKHTWRTRDSAKPKLINEYERKTMQTLHEAVWICMLGHIEILLTHLNEPFNLFKPIYVWADEYYSDCCLCSKKWTQYLISNTSSIFEDGS